MLRRRPDSPSSGDDLTRWGDDHHRLRYEIRVRGALGRSKARAFPDMELTVETVFRGPLVGLPALYGLLDRIYALRLELVDVRPCDDHDDRARFAS